LDPPTPSKTKIPILEDHENKGSIYTIKSFCEVQFKAVGWPIVLDAWWYDFL